MYFFFVNKCIYVYIYKVIIFVSNIYILYFVAVFENGFNFSTM